MITGFNNNRGRLTPSPQNNILMYNPKYFSLAELCRSNTATAKGIDNTPDFYQVFNLCRLCELVLDPVREIVKRPIIVTSGYRSQELNKAVGGVITSQHVFGCAADIVCADMLGLENALKANKNFDQLILEKRNNGKNVWFHVSVPLPNTTPRQQFLTISK